MAARRRLAYDGTAARVTWTAVLPLVLLAIGLWRFPPPSEYIIGGKDPGSYISEGVQIAKTGALVIPDRVAAAVPASVRGLFFPPHPSQEYYSTRFMGFFLLDPDTGSVVGQFPHLYPASIALGFETAGLRGALLAVTGWTIFGLRRRVFRRRAAGRPARGVRGGAAARHPLDRTLVWPLPEFGSRHAEPAVCRAARVRAGAPG